MSFFFFFNATATTEIYTLSLHDALPIYRPRAGRKMQTESESPHQRGTTTPYMPSPSADTRWRATRTRSEEHTSELQSHSDLVCRLLLEKKKKKKNNTHTKTN